MFVQPFKKPPTVERLRELLDYDPVTGVFTWQRRTDPGSEWWNGRYAGTVAGSVSKKDGYLWIAVDDVKYTAQRLAWLHFHGDLPLEEIDHKNTTRTENWIDNLRPATVTQQRHNMNRHKDSITKLKGVSHNKKFGFRSRIHLNGKEVTLGYFRCPAAASFAYQIAADKNFGQFANGGLK